MGPDHNKAIARRLFEEIFPSGDPVSVSDLVAELIVDHDPMPGQPPGIEGIEWVVTTLHRAHPDLRFVIDDMVAEADRVAVRWTLRGTNTGPMFGNAPSGEQVEQSAVVIFRIENGKIAERWAGFRP